MAGKSDCFRLMGVHEADIDKLLSKEMSGQLIISKSKLYALAGNSIVTNCLTVMFEELIFPSWNHYNDKTYHQPYQAINELCAEGKINWCRTLNDMAFTIKS